MGPDRRPPHGTGFVIATAAGVVFWACVALAALAARSVF